MTAMKTSDATAPARPEPLAWIIDGDAAVEPAVRQHRAERLAELRRDRVKRPTIFVGAGTCGLGAGAKETLAAIHTYLDSHEIKADVVKVGCIGICSLEPIVEVQLPERARVCFKQVTGAKIPLLLDQALHGSVPEGLVLGQHRHATLPAWPDVPYLDEHPFFAPQTRWVLANCGIIDPAEINEYIAHGGYKALADVLAGKSPDQVCDMVEASGLRGRGGGGFPTGKKWKFARSAPGTQKYLICNADEGDPGAFMDRAVIESDPHRLLEGMAIAAYGIGATKAYVYIRAEYPLAIQRLRAAIAQAEAGNLLGDNILGSGFDLHVIIKMGAGAFVCGEETALIHSIEGKRGMPRPRPPFPAIRGLFGKPTIINNVETLANLPTLAAHGADWFSAVGTKTSKGTKVFALSGKVSRTGLVEVVMGTPVRKIIFDIGGGIPNGKAYKAVQIGGPSGGCIPTQHLDIDVDYESLKTVGAMMGSGGLVVMDEDTCMVDVAKFFMDFIQRESCGKCIPCREGTRRMLEILERITRGRKKERGIQALERFKSVLHLQNLAETIRDTSLCGLGQTAPNPVLSTLRWFRDEYESHIYERSCPAAACAELVSYHIDAEKCKGCSICAKKCPVGAILGAPKSPYHVVEEKCIGCGSCLDACRFDAIVKQ
jgi:NADH:ubiquinone oxidoreductase subunit F (NADH-binding)/NAD-dependent dihydropyrimidine dehydrogenase PreA subunit